MKPTVSANGYSAAENKLIDHYNLTNMSTYYTVDALYQELVFRSFTQKDNSVYADVLRLAVLARRHGVYRHTQEYEAILSALPEDADLKTTIYVVRGCCGEYSDRVEWSVIAYTKRGDAESHVAAATARAREIKADLAFKPYKSRHDLLATEPNQFDPGMRADYTETTYYYYEEVELLDSRCSTLFSDGGECEASDGL